MVCGQAVCQCSWKWGHQNLTTSFPSPIDDSVQVWLKSTYWLTKQTVDKAHFYSLNTVVTLKTEQGHQNLIIFSSIPVIQYMKFGLNPSFGSRDRVQTSFIWSNLHSKRWYDLENEAKVTKSSHFFFCPNGASVQVWSKSMHRFTR